MAHFIYTMKGLGKIYPPDQKVFEDIWLSFIYGAKIGIIGGNGAGKSTLMKIMAGVDQNYLGEAFRAENSTVGYLSQEPSVFRKLTVEENILAILETLPLSEKERKFRLDYLLEELDIAPLRKSKAYMLSGGERRRLEITRALVTAPKLMLLDEPFSGVDPIAVYEVQQIITELKRKGLGILVTDHNVRETLGICDRAYIINEGGVLASGHPEAIINDENVRRVYLGENFRL